MTLWPSLHGHGIVQNEWVALWKYWVPTSETIEMLSYNEEKFESWNVYAYHPWSLWEFFQKSQCLVCRFVIYIWPRAVPIGQKIAATYLVSFHISWSRKYWWTPREKFGSFKLELQSSYFDPKLADCNVGRYITSLAYEQQADTKLDIFVVR